MPTMRCHASTTRKPSEKLQKLALALSIQLTTLDSILDKSFPWANKFKFWKDWLKEDQMMSLPEAEEEWTKACKSAEAELDAFMFKQGFKLARNETSGRTNGNLTNFEFEFTRYYTK